MIKKIGPRYSPYHKERLEMLRFLKQKGVKIFSDPQSIINCYDRLSCTLILQAGGIPMPDTFITESVDEAYSIIKEYKEVILKPLFSSKARGMIILKAEDENLKEKLINFQNDSNPVIYVQKRINIPGQDLGAVFLGGKYVATYARVAGKDAWNTTTLSGGKYQKVNPSKEILEIVDKAQSLFNLSFTSVDIVETEQGPMVFEVSAFGGFRGLWDSHGIDAAELYTDYVLRSI